MEGFFSALPNWRGIFALFHLYDEVLAGRPEALWVGDAEHILLLGITLERVRACGMVGQDLS